MSALRTIAWGMVNPEELTMGEVNELLQAVNKEIEPLRVRIVQHFPTATVRHMSLPPGYFLQKYMGKARVWYTIWHPATPEGSFTKVCEELVRRIDKKGHQPPAMRGRDLKRAIKRAQKEG